MPRFAVTRSFWHLARDLVVLIGEHVEGVVQPGQLVHLPGLGECKVQDVDVVKMGDGSLVPCLIFPASILEADQLFEPSTLDGTTVSVVSEPG